METPRSNVVTASIAVASTLVSIAAIAGIAWFLGWIPSDKGAPPPPVAIASPGSQVAGSAPDAALLPGETVVNAEAAKAPPATTESAAAVPRYNRPPPPKPVEATKAVEAPKRVEPPPVEPPPPVVAQPVEPPPRAEPPRPAPVTPKYAQSPKAGPAPVTPSYARRAESAPPPSLPENYCVNCGVVSAVTFATDTWDVRVRFEDGSRETFRFPERPRFRVGEKVRVEDGRLELDR